MYYILLAMKSGVTTAQYETFNTLMGFHDGTQSRLFTVVNSAIKFGFCAPFASRVLFSFPARAIPLLFLPGYSDSVVGRIKSKKKNIPNGFSSCWRLANEIRSFHSLPSGNSFCRVIRKELLCKVETCEGKPSMEQSETAR